MIRMNPETKKIIAKILSGRHFSKAVDLGCGEGYYGDVLKAHTDHLIGVDHNPGRLSVAKKYSGYDEVHLSEVQDYKIPYNADAVFMFDLIEHLSEADALDLLLRTRHIPFALIATPTFFHSFSFFRNHHQSLWTEKELREEDFKTIRYNKGLFGLFVEGVIAWRD